MSNPKRMKLVVAEEWLSVAVQGPRGRHWITCRADEVLLPRLDELCEAIQVDKATLVFTFRDVVVSDTLLVSDLAGESLRMDPAPVAVEALEAAHISNLDKVIEASVALYAKEDARNTLDLELQAIRYRMELDALALQRVQARRDLTDEQCTALTLSHELATKAHRDSHDALYKRREELQEAGL